MGRYSGEHVEVIVPVYERDERTNKTLWSISVTADMPFRLLMTEGKQCVAKNRNEGLAQVPDGHRLVVQIDADVLLPPGWMSQMAAVLDQNENVGVVSTARMGVDLKPQRGFGPFPNDAVIKCLPPATCVMYDQERTKGCAFDEEYEASLVEDTDFMLQVQQKGLLTVVLGSVLIMHDGGATASNPEIYQRNLERFQKKWAERATPTGGK